MNRRAAWLLVFAFLFLAGAAAIHAQTMFYWEAPEIFSSGAGTFPVSAFSDDLSVIAWQETTPNRDSNIAAAGMIRVALAVKKPGQSWERKGFVGGPYPYSGTEPSILSAVIDRRGRIIIAAAASTTQTEILISENQGESFSRHRVNMGSETSVAPRLYARADGGYLLFVTRGREQTLSIYFARSDNGIDWSPFELFVQDRNLQLNFLPVHGSIGAEDFVFFQSFVSSGDSVPTFQLFFKTSVDGGATWSAAKLFTSFNDPVMNTNMPPERFDNERPFVVSAGERLFLVWERRFGTRSPQIYSAFIGRGGEISGDVTRVNTEEAYCNNPVAFIYDNSPTVVWFDNRRGGNRIFIGQETGAGWQNYDLSGASGEALFARPAAGPDGLYVFWQVTARGASRIYSLSPDLSTAAPRISPQNFTAGRRGLAERVRLSWNVPNDTSGILGFSWTWSQTKDVLPEQRIMIYNSNNAADRRLDLNADGDGSWFFNVIAQDFAGNWSAPASVEYIRDTTPPPAAVIIEPETDENGWLVSNTFSMNWNPPPASDIAGYTWNLQYLGNISETAAAGITPEAPPSRIMGRGSSVNYNNYDNGSWYFTVAAIDEVGNIGPRSSVFFRTNKYIPYTSVSLVDSSQDEQGLLSVRILGRGFLANGTISRIILDRDGRPPYDREFFLDRDDYQVTSDRLISGLRVEDMEEGVYRLILQHPQRGLYMTAPLVAVDEKGTVKFGDYEQVWKASWTRRDDRRFVLDSSLVLMAVLLALCLAGFVVLIRGIGGVIAEGQAVKVEAAAIMTGDYMPLEKKKRITKIKRRGIGLSFKLASFTIVLVLLVVTMVSVPLYYMMTRTQRETLLQSLWDRSSVLLEGLASSARAYLPMANPELELINLPSQMAAIPEARYVTITGYGSGNTVYNDHVWASNDPDILSKIDTAEFRPGVSRIQDILTPRLEEIGTELNEAAREEVGEISSNITELTREAISLALRTDTESQNRMNDIQVTIQSLQTRITRALTSMSRQISSQPEFSTSQLDPDGNVLYILFKPVMFRQGSDNNYFRGLIRLEISVEAIQAQISSGQTQLLRIILLIALVTITIGTIGALALAALIVRPIRKLAGHVERIRDTEDKSKLAGVDIHIASRDEIAVLGDTINDMTHGLVKAAAAASDLSIGKEIQKKFIPLELDRDGNKLSAGYKDTKNAEFFGYYEGAKGVSGDYFDYQDLDGRYYAIIKCDVAGKGIPAALIMIQVATMFLNYFKQWKPTAKGMRIEELVYEINEFIETLGFKGRFAAFTLCLFDSQTGIARFCNAGDNIVHFYDASEGRIKTVSLPETPATGVLPNFLVESKGGYTVQTLTIDHGDILFLYTDGIEEAKRKFRDAKFNEILCAEGPADTPHGNHVSGQGDEEMGPDRVRDIINAVMNKQIYRLQKWHNGEGDKELTFDFSACEGKVEEVIMALVAVEKMFRCFKNPASGEDARVLVDKKIDSFLKNHFLQYRTYCSFTREYPSNEAYMYYTHVKEDEQYDDLTILGIKRK